MKVIFFFGLWNSPQSGDSCHRCNPNWEDFTACLQEEDSLRKLLVMLKRILSDTYEKILPGKSIVCSPVREDINASLKKLTAGHFKKFSKLIFCFWKKKSFFSCFHFLDATEGIHLCKSTRKQLPLCSMGLTAKKACADVLAQSYPDSCAAVLLRWNGLCCIQHRNRNC